MAPRLWITGRPRDGWAMLHEVWSQIAQDQAGTVSRGQLRSDGLSENRIDRLLATGALSRQARNAYLVRGAPLTALAQIWIAVHATGGVAGFGTAGRQWGVWPDAPALIEMIVAHERRIAAPFGVHLNRVFLPRSAQQRLDGLPVTTRRWTILDLLGRLPAEDAQRLADRALQRKWITVDDIAARLSEYPGRRGNAALRLLAAQAGDGAAAASERQLHRLLRAAGLSGWSANFPVHADGVLVAVVDVAFPARRLAIEVDGWAFHNDVERFQRDRHRQNDLHLLGWTVIRFTWADLTGRPGYVVATVRTQLARAA